MKLLWAFVLQGTILAANGERHKLTYIYTGLSKPINLPGIHQFTAMGMLDDRIIDYYDSVDQRKIPKVDWMKENLPADYWEKGTQSLQIKQQWFKTNIDILIERMRQNNTDLHVLQWMHGCEGETQPDGRLKFVSGMDKYNYDGDDSLSFDITLGFLVAPTVAVEPTKIQDLKENPIGYLEKECIYWLSKFLEYVKEQLKQAKPPTVQLFEKKSNIQRNIVLTCLATGFIPKETEMKIKWGNRVLTGADGVQSTGPLPNGDGTFQRRDHIEVPKDDRAKYTCEVSHTVSGFSVTSTWVMTESPSDGGSGFLIGLVVGGGLVVLTLVGVITVLVFFLKKKGSSASSVITIYIPVTPVSQVPSPLVGNRSTNFRSDGSSNSSSEGIQGGSRGSTNSGVAFYSSVIPVNQVAAPLVGNRSTSVRSGGTTNPGRSRGINDSGVTSAANHEEAKDLLANATDADPDKAKDLLADATEANPDEAKDLLADATEANPDKAKDLLANATDADPEEPKDLLAKATDADPEEPKDLLADAAEALPDKAKDLLAKATEANPDKAKDLLADATEANPDKAKDLLANATEANPDKAKDLLADAAEANPDKAKDLLADAAEAFPKETKVLLANATEANPEEAKDLLANATEANPEEAKDILANATEASPEETSVSVPDA